MKGLSIKTFSNFSHQRFAVIGSSKGFVPPYSQTFPLEILKFLLVIDYRNYDGIVVCWSVVSQINLIYMSIHKIYPCLVVGKYTVLVGNKRNLLLAQKEEKLVENY